jgi:hypothetical protein
MMFLDQAWRPNIWLTSLLASTLAVTALAGMPMAASAHQPKNPVDVDCREGIVHVSVPEGEGKLKITRTSPAPVKVTEKAVPESATTVDFSIAEIGGNGSFTAVRAENPDEDDPADDDPAPVEFTVACPPTFTLAKTVAEGDGATVKVNSVLHYTVTLHNSSIYNGPAPTITDTITGTAAYSVVDGPTASQGTVSGSASPWSWAPGSLAGGADALVTLNVKVTGDGTIINTAVIGEDRHSVQNVAQTPPGTLTGVVLFCNADGTAGGPASGTITIPGTSAAAGTAAPAKVTTVAGSYAITASNAPTGNEFVNCGAAGGTVSGDKHSAVQPGIVTPDNNTVVTFYVKAVPAQAVQAANSGGTQASAVLGATITMPNTGRGDATRTLMIALGLMMLGIALILGQAFHRPATGR